MKTHGVLFIVSFLATVQLAMASLHQYIVCPTNTLYSTAAFDNTPYPSNDPATNFRAALMKCDGDDAACIGVDGFTSGHPNLSGIQIYQSVQQTGGLATSVVNTEGLALREESKAEFILRFGDHFPNDCYSCFSQADGSCPATSCSSGLVLFQGQCLSACPSSTYNKSGVCTDCTTIDPQAATCSSTTALSCTSSYNLYNGTCVVQCPSSTYTSNGVCKSCTLIDPHALTCSATAVLTCAAPYTLSKEGACVCKSGRYNPGAKDCPSGSKEHGESHERREHPADDRNERE